MTERFRILTGDCEDLLRSVAPESVDAVVTDPPYGLSALSTKVVRTAIAAWLRGERCLATQPGFASCEWDSLPADPRQWQAVYQALKPGGHVLAFGGTRSFDLAALALRFAGFDIRDDIGILSWSYGNGFPKTKQLSREVVDKGISTALKPAFEPVLVARKPFKKSLAENLAEHGVGALNIDACRVPAADCYAVHPKGRWPPNLALVHHPVCREAECHPSCHVLTLGTSGLPDNDMDQAPARLLPRFWPDVDSLSYYCPKPTRAEREQGLDHLPTADERDDGRIKGAGWIEQWGDRRNMHPTVKPVALMRWLVRLVAPGGGVVLDPFCGSGSTGVAAMLEGARFLGCERDPVHVDIASARIAAAAGLKPPLPQAPPAGFRQPVRQLRLFDARASA